MGTDREETDRAPCPCGKGAVIVFECMPDHGFGGRMWEETDLRCESCEKTLVLLHGTTTVVPKAAFEERVKKDRERSARYEALMHSAQVESLRGALRAFLENQRTKAAAFRALDAHGLVYGSLDSFRRGFSDAESWVQSNIDGYHLQRTADMLGAPLDPVIGDELAALERLRAEIDAPYADAIELRPRRT